MRVIYRRRTPVILQSSICSGCAWQQDAVCHIRNANAPSRVWPNVWYWHPPRQIHRQSGGIEPVVNLSVRVLWSKLSWVVVEWSRVCKYLENCVPFSCYPNKQGRWHLFVQRMPHLRCQVDWDPGMVDVLFCTSRGPWVFCLEFRNRVQFCIYLKIILGE